MALQQRSDIDVQAQIRILDVRENCRYVLRSNAFGPARQEEYPVMRQFGGKLLNERRSNNAGSAGDDRYRKVVTLFT